VNDPQEPLAAGDGSPVLPPAVSGERVLLDTPSGQVSCYRAGLAKPGSMSEGSAAITPMLLVHSVNAAASAYEVRPLHEYFAASRPVYSLDLPGYGFSERRPGEYTPRQMTDALHAVVALIHRDHGAVAVDALALSLSSEFLARAAVEDPATFRSLALVSPTGFSGPRRRYEPVGGSRKVDALYRFFSRPVIGAPVFRWLTRPGVIRYFLQRTWGGKAIDEGMWAYDVITTRQPGAWHAPISFLTACLFSTDINALYEKLVMPVWMSHGVRGDFVDYRGIDTVRGRPNWTFTVFQAGALPHFEAGVPFLAEYERFLAVSRP
jgi:pimeloyl-ACP methyl ester carboxylesterase